MKTLKRRVAALTNAACATAFGVALTLQLVAPVHANAAAARSAVANPPLWVIRDHDSTIYLFGTVHLMKEGTRWRTAKVDRALADADELWLEIAEAGDPKAAEAAMAKLVPQYGVDPAKPLSTKLYEPDRTRLKTAAAAAGVKPEQLEPLRPWLAALLLTVGTVQKAGFKGESGVDVLLARSVKAAGKPVRGFETVEQQLRFFADLSPEIERQFLVQTIDTAEEGPAMLDRLASAWARGDLATFDRIFNSEMREQSPALYKTIIVDRNEAWAKLIQERLAGSGESFVAVGAGHLSGPDSVQARLQARGIKAVRR